MKVSIKHFDQRYKNLKNERDAFIPTWQKLADYHLHYRGRFLSEGNKKVFERNDKQINNHSRLASRTLSAGMMAGITSPARPWFRLSAPSDELNEIQAVKSWLFEVQNLIYRVFNDSNFYSTLQKLYSELGVFGTASMGIYPDFENVIHCKTYTIGSYCLGTNGRDKVDTFYREYEITVAQCVKEFGLENCSEHVQLMWEKGNSESPVKVMHCIEPNDNRNLISPLAKHKKFRSVYYEVNKKTKKEDTYLRESGFDVFPNVSPRWETVGEDIYATSCPGMDALGDTMSLQLGETRTYQALDKIAQNKLQGPSSLINFINSKGGLSKVDLIPNDDANAILKPVYALNPSFDHLTQKLDTVENRISRAFYEDLFLMLANSDRRQITAREIAEKHEEKLLMLGPVLESVHGELLDPAIDITYHRLESAGLLPPIPDELDGVDLKVSYVSVLAQAQRLVAVGSIERSVGFAAELANVWPEARHKINVMKALNEYADANGVDPNIIRSDDEVQNMVDDENEAIAQQQQMEQVAAGADAAKTISETNVSEDNALGSLLRGTGLA